MGEPEASGTVLSRMMARSRAEEDEEEDEVLRPAPMTSSFSSGRSAMLMNSGLHQGPPSAMIASSAAALDAAAAAVTTTAQMKEESNEAASLSTAGLSVPISGGGGDVEPPSFVGDSGAVSLEPIEAVSKIEEDDENKDEGDKYLAAAVEDDEGVPVIELFCLCQMPWNPNHFMVACDDCNEWYHDKCLGVPQEELEKVDRYVCPWCVEKRKRQEVRKRVWESDRTAKLAAKRARQAARKREQVAQRKLRSKPCKNLTCTERSRLGSKYCSDSCGLEVAATAHREAEERRIQESVKQSVAEQESKLNLWIEAHSDFLEHAAPSVSTQADLELLEEAQRGCEALERECKDAEMALAEAEMRAAQGETRNPAGPPSDVEGSARLDCSVCGKDVPAVQFVSHLRECMHRNEEFSHSTVAQNPGFCNHMSRRTDRYCNMPKNGCMFHTPGLGLDYQFLVCGYQTSDQSSPPCPRAALQCLKHNDWRHVSVEFSKNRLANVRQQLVLQQKQANHARIRIASREMYAELIK